MYGQTIFSISVQEWMPFRPPAVRPSGPWGEVVTLLLASGVVPTPTLRERAASSPSCPALATTRAVVEKARCRAGEKKAGAAPFGCECAHKSLLYTSSLCCNPTYVEHSLQPLLPPAPWKWVAGVRYSAVGRSLLNPADAKAVVSGWRAEGREALAAQWLQPLATAATQSMLAG